ncbi:MAG TPA: hypothetical protein PKE69_04470 [Pyrinomonadaceae bacterium]|nr:hypothetical protein [Pyrinomonadaceae bacterium]
MLFLLIFLAIVLAVILWLLFWSLVSFITGQRSYQKQFTDGQIPKQKPEGFYCGTAHLIPFKKVPWLGKSFTSEENSGFNIFTPSGAKLLKLLTPLYKLFSVNGDNNTNAYNFKTFIGKGLKDKDLQVIKLDYNAPENPFLIRIILDEIVEIAPKQFLGKVHLKVFPTFYATIGYFGLTRKWEKKFDNNCFD